MESELTRHGDKLAPVARRVASNHHDGGKSQINNRLQYGVITGIKNETNIASVRSVPYS
jgi:hypothetical protein